MNFRQRLIYCCGCEYTVTARLTNGREVYPNQARSAFLPFWKCDICGNKVGCHWKTQDRIRPLGVIPTKEISAARIVIHNMLDPIWKKGWMSRSELYQLIAKKLGITKYHTAEIRTIEECDNVCRVIKEIESSLRDDGGVKVND